MKEFAPPRIAVIVTLLWGVVLSLVAGCDLQPTAKTAKPKTIQGDAVAIVLVLTKTYVLMSHIQDTDSQGNYYSLSFNLGVLVEGNTAITAVADSIDFRVALVNGGGFDFTHGIQKSFQIVGQDDCNSYSLELTSTDSTSKENHVYYHLRLKNPDISCTAGEVFAMGNLIVMVDDAGPDCWGYINIDEIVIWHSAAPVPYKKAICAYKIAPTCSDLGEK